MQAGFFAAVRRSETTAWQAIMKQFVYVYILVSEVDAAKHYTGISHHLFGRLQEQSRPLPTHREIQTLEDRNGYRICI